MNTRKFKLIIPVKKLAFIVLSLFFMAYMYADSALDTAITNHDLTAIANILENAPDGEKSVNETAVLEASEQAIMNNDLDYALSLAEAVLLVNLDNMEAQQMYTSIQESKRQKAESDRKAAEQKAHQEQLAEEKRLAAERQAIEQREAQEKEAYLQTLQVIDKNNFPCSIGIAAASFDFAKSPFADSYDDDSQLNCRYGFGGNIQAAFVHPYIKTKLSASFLYAPAVITGEGKKTDINVLLSIGMPSFTKAFAISVGYRRYAADGDIIALYPVFAGPFVGLGVDDIPLFKNFTLSFYAGWNITPLVEESEIDFAFDSKLTLRYSFAINDTLAWYIENATMFDGLVIQSDLEWTANTAFSVGVSINEN